MAQPSHGHGIVCPLRVAGRDPLRDAATTGPQAPDQPDASSRPEQCMKQFSLFPSSLEKLKYFFQEQQPYPQEKPVVLQFPVIDICNSRCQMCRIWENHQSRDITTEELRQGLRNSLFSEVRSVGLNGGEPTLRKDLAALTSVLFDELPKLQTIALITNAFKYSEVITRIREVGEVVQAHGGKLDVMVSLDGYGEMHDRVRGKRGNFKRALRTLDYITASPLVSNVRIGCTIIRENVYGLADLFDFCQERGIYIKYRLGIPHKRLYTENLLDPYALTPEEKYHVAEFLEGLIRHYETSIQQKFFYRSLIGQILHKAPRAAGCDWRHRAATITARGELLYCAVQSKTLGLIASSDSEALYFGNRDHLNEIVEHHCDSCHHDYTGIPPQPAFRRQLMEEGLQRSGLRPLAEKIYLETRLGRLLRRHRYRRRQEALATLAATARGMPVPEATERPGIIICGWYGTETLGDKAILGGVLKAIRSVVPDAPITLVSLNPYVSKMTRRQMPELRGVKIVTPEQGIVLAKHADLVVFGGGPLMAINQMAEIEVLFEQAREARVPRFIAGCGVGPLGEPWMVESLRRVLQLASFRLYRDEGSRVLAAKLGIDTSGDVVAEDPALTWLAGLELPPRPAPTEPPVLLLGLRDFPWAQYGRALSKAECIIAKDRYEQEVLAALEVLAARHPSLVIRPLPMCTNHFGDDDRWFYRRLFRSNAALREHLDYSLLEAELEPIAYVNAFRTATAALTMRFHACVFALGLGTPQVAIDYTLGEGKVHHLTAHHRVPCQSLDYLDRQFLVDAIEKLLAAPRMPATLPPEPSFSKVVARYLPRLLT